MSCFLNEAKKQDHVDFYIQILEKKFEDGGSKCMHDIITGHESWFYYDDSETKRPSQVRIVNNDVLSTIVCRQCVVRKHMFTIFFNKTWFENNHFYWKQLISIQMDAFRMFWNKWRNVDVLTHHDNASVHKASQIMKYLDAQPVKLDMSIQRTHHIWVCASSEYFRKLTNSFVAKNSTIFMSFVMLSKRNSTAFKKKTFVNATKIYSKEWIDALVYKGTT